jgi:predicted negative regulator of RcsB-dependent stress response
MRLSSRDVVWVTIVLILICVALVQWRQIRNLKTAQARLERLAYTPRSVFIGPEEHQLPQGARKAIPDFSAPGVLVSYEP